MYSRRTILKSLAAASLVTLNGSYIREIRAHPCDLPLRRSVGELDLDDPILETYREFVTLMKAKPDNDPASWIGFSNVHGTQFSFNFCPHGSWYFLPWHRAYTHMYEVMCRELTGNQDFAMPYWDWTVDRQIPAAFADETWQGNPNPLFDSTRTMSPFASLPDDMVGQFQVMDDIYSETNFELFGSSRPRRFSGGSIISQDSLDQSWITAGGGAQGPLESNPHNRVHCTVGGRMCSPISPQDPIFVTHHGNIDRIWAQWNSLGRSNSGDPLWLDMPFQDNFVAPDGSTYTKIVNELLDVEALGYSYGFESVQQPETLQTARDADLQALFSGAILPEASGMLRVKAANDVPAQALKPLSVSLKVDGIQLEKAVEPSSTIAIESIEEKPEIFAFIKNIVAPPEGKTDFRVFVNCDYLSQDVPTTDPHYVTTIGFFGKPGGHDQHDKALPTVAIKLTETLTKLKRSKRLTGDNITVQILPVPQLGMTMSDVGAITPAEIEIVII